SITATLAASHASWRTARGDQPAAPGACVALYTVITPSAETARERSGRTHSKWVRSLRSNFIGGPVRCSGAAPPRPALLRCPPDPRRSPAAKPRAAPAAAPPPHGRARRLAP